MGRWRTKMLFSLILYGAGFVTAVYVLAPSPAAASGGTGVCERSFGVRQGTEEAGFSSQDRAAQMRAGIDKAVSFAEDNAVKAFRAAKVQLDQWRQNNGQ